MMNVRNSVHDPQIWAQVRGSAVAKSPVSQKDEDELHEERLLMRCGPAPRGGDEGRPGAQ